MKQTLENLIDFNENACLPSSLLSIYKSSFRRFNPLFVTNLVTLFSYDHGRIEHRFYIKKKKNKTL